MFHRLVKIKSFLFLILLFLVQCGKTVYQSPDEVYEAAINSVENIEPKIFINLISEKSRKAVSEKMNLLKENFAFIPSNPEARKAYEEVAGLMGISIEKLSNFNMEHYIRYVMQIEGKGKGANTNIIPINIFKKALVQEKKIKQNSAEFLFENSEPIRFIRTESGWKLCLI